MLNALRKLQLRNGYLSGIVIDEAPGCPSSSAYTSRFGSLLRTYDLIGYKPYRDYRYVEINHRLRELYPKIVSLAEKAMADTGARVKRDHASGLLWVNEEFKVSLALSRCRPPTAHYTNIARATRSKSRYRPYKALALSLSPMARRVSMQSSSVTAWNPEIEGASATKCSR
jgi:hypothetical protein